MPKRSGNRHNKVKKKNNKTELNEIFREMIPIPPLIRPIPSSPPKMVTYLLKSPSIRIITNKNSKYQTPSHTPPTTPPDTLPITPEFPTTPDFKRTPEITIPKAPDFEFKIPEVPPPRWPALIKIDIPDPDWQAYKALPKADPRQKIWRTLQLFGTGAATPYSPSRET